MKNCGFDQAMAHRRSRDYLFSVGGRPLSTESRRRNFLKYLGAAPLVGAGAAMAQPPPVSSPSASGASMLPAYARRQDYDSLKQSN